MIFVVSDYKWNPESDDQDESQGKPSGGLSRGGLESDLSHQQFASVVRIHVNSNPSAGLEDSSEAFLSVRELSSSGSSQVLLHQKSILVRLRLFPVLLQRKDLLFFLIVVGIFQLLLNVFIGGLIKCKVEVVVYHSVSPEATLHSVRHLVWLEFTPLVVEEVVGDVRALLEGLAEEI